MKLCIQWCECVTFGSPYVPKLLQYDKCTNKNTAMEDDLLCVNSGMAVLGCSGRNVPDITTERRP